MQNDRDYYDEFDYSNEDGSILCKLKSRRCTYNEYNDTMLNCSKLNKCNQTRMREKRIKILIDDATELRADPATHNTSHFN